MLAPTTKQDREAHYMLAFLLVLYFPTIYMIDSDQRPDSNRRPFQMLRSMADLFIMVKAYIIGRRFEKVRNDHIFENLKKDIDLRIGRRFENLKKGHRSEVQMYWTSI